MNWHWWFVTFLGLLVLEVAMPGGFGFACLAGGALAACLAGALGAGAALAWLLFGGGTLLLLAAVAPAVRRRAPAPPAAAGLRGQRALVTEALDPRTGRGVVQVAQGTRWLAAAEAPVAAGTWVEVLEVRGDRLRVRPAFPGLGDRQERSPGLTGPLGKASGRPPAAGPAGPGGRARPGPP